VRLSAAAKSGRDGEALSEGENLFYNLPGCSGPVHGFSGIACKTLPFEIVEKTISPTICRITRVLQASTIYTDDGNLAATANTVGISTLGLADLPLTPETAQGQLPFESNKADAIDEIAKQAESLQEPPLPNDPPAAQ
jgi:hypothetical protein